MQQTRVQAPPPKKQRTEESQQAEMEQLAAEHATRDDRPPVDLEGLDEFLDEVDALLEENAEEFVAAYVQRGGE